MSSSSAAASSAVVRRHVLHDVQMQARSLDGWEQEYLQLSRGAYTGEIVTLDLPGTTVFFESSNQRLHERCLPPAGTLVFATPLSLADCGWMQGAEWGAQSSILSAGGRLVDLRTPSSLTLAAMVIEPGTVGALSETWGVGARLRVLSDEGNVSSGSLQPTPLREAMRAVFEGLNAGTVCLTGSASQVALRDGLTSLLAAAVGGVADDDRRGAARPSTSSHQRIVDRATAWMRERLDQPLSMGELSAAVQAHPRVLQYSFRRVLGMTPVAYLRVLRLHAVRRELRTPGPQAPSIGDIASRWGSWHLSRFATEYRQLFGELPSETLARALTRN